MTSSTTEVPRAPKVNRFYPEPKSHKAQEALQERRDCVVPNRRERRAMRRRLLRHLKRLAKQRV